MVQISLRNGFSAFFTIACITLVLLSCQHKPNVQVAPDEPDHFPPAISKIIQSNCNVSGCHNKASYEVSGGGLLLDSWDHLFDGGNHGAVVVPFSPENSSLLYFINHYPDLGPVPADVSMRMPLNGTPLSREDILTIQNWIAAGAPDDQGAIPFASDADSRQKIYLAHQGCDFVSVIDADRHVVMRTIPIGKIVTIEAAYDLKTAADGLAYVSLWASDAVARINTRTDSLLAGVEVGTPNNTRLQISSADNSLFLTSLYTGTVQRIPSNGQAPAASYGSGLFVNPHAIAADAGFDTLFVTEQQGNIVYKLPAAGAPSTNITRVSLNGMPPALSGTGMPNPYDIVMAPDHSRYFVSCPGTNDVRVMDARTNKLIKTIPVGRKPQNLAVSRNSSTPYLFVSCEDDTNAVSYYRGAVYLIDYNTLQIVRKIGDRHFMPHAMAVDDRSGMLYVFSRNIDPNGPLPHHNSASCSGRSGYYSVYDFRNLRPINNKRYEVIVDPFAADVRFK